ncbi:MAG TPA: hypothetical protein VFF48_06225 [Brevundimonas sp.]|nr:hypothetical protein [Brevundimonas sp.]
MEDRAVMPSRREGQDMRNGAVIAGLTGGLMLFAVADMAAAQTQNPSARTRAPAVSLSEAQSARSAGPSRLRFTERGRWGLDLNLSQPQARESTVGDVEAGAYYRVNPRLRVGAAAGLAETDTDPAGAPPTERRSAPRFRLESIFRF